MFRCHPLLRNPIIIYKYNEHRCTQAIEEEVKKSGASGEVCPVRCDLRRESDIMDMFQLIRNKYGRIDVCINNAGIAWKQDKLSEGDTEEWREMLNVSVIWNE